MKANRVEGFTFEAYYADKDRRDRIQRHNAKRELGEVEDCRRELQTRVFISELQPRKEDALNEEQYQKSMRLYQKRIDRFKSMTRKYSQYYLEVKRDRFHVGRRAVAKAA